MNTHTARARAAAQQDYRSFVEKSNAHDLAAWISNMQSRGLSANTIRQRVSLVRHWMGIEENVVLPIRRNIRESNWLNHEQVQALLAVIPNNESGRRDFALFAALLITGLRLGQLRNWKWSSIHQRERSATAAGINFSKVILDVLQTIPSQRTDAHLTNVLPSLTTDGEDFIFTASHRSLRTGQSKDISSYITVKRRPLSPQEINRRIKRYARLAGLEPQGISAESLRRTCKELGRSALTALVQNALRHRNAGPVRWKRVERDPHLHGIGRRGFHT